MDRINESKTAQEQLESTSRDILRGYPLAAGLMPISDVPSLLPIPMPFPPSLSDPTLSDAGSGLDEPLFQQYANEIQAILNGNGGIDPRVLNAVSDEMETNGRVFSYIPPPFPIPSTSNASRPSTSSTASTFVSALSLDRIAPPPSSSQTVHTSPSAADSQRFFSDFLQETKSRRPLPPSPQKKTVVVGPFSPQGIVRQPPPKPQPNPSQSAPLVPESSPDPLRILPSGPSRKRSSPSLSSRSSLSPTKSHKSSSFLGVEIELPSPRKKLTESQMRGYTPGEDFESAVKKMRLVSGGDMSVGSSGRGAVRGGGPNDILDKLSDFVDDIFTADDLFISDTSNANMASKSGGASTSTPLFHVDKTSLDSHPLLSTSTLKKLVKMLTSVVLKNKGEEMLEMIEEGGIGRLLKVLERSWKGMGVEDLSWWASEAEGVRMERANDNEKKGTKKAKGKKVAKEKDRESDDENGEEYSPNRPSVANGSRRSSRSRSRSPTVRQSEDVQMDGAEEENDEIWTDEAMLTFSDNTELLIDALCAMRASLLVLTSTNLPRHLYSADYITSIISTLRHILNSFVLPLLEAPSDSYLADLLGMESTAIGPACEAIEPIFSILAELVINEEMSEEIVISTIYFALSPFFKEAAPMTAAGRGRKSETGHVVGVAMKGIRIGALSLTRALWAAYSDQRQWMVQEILDHLTGLDIAKKGKGSLRLRTGATIHTTSSLLLQLVQTPPRDLQSRAQRRLRAREKGEEAEMRPSQLEEDEDAEENEDEGEEVTPIGRIVKELLDPAIESATKTVRQIVSFLLHKSCKAGKATSGSTESEYRAVFDNLITDVLATLHLPEWPASDLFLGVCVKSMLSTLGDPKNFHDLNAVKSLALDHIGPIGARLAQDAAAVSNNQIEQLKSLQDIFAESDCEGLRKLYLAHQMVISQVAKIEKQSGASSSASQFSVALIGRELASAVQRAATAAEQFEEHDSKEGLRAKEFHEALSQLAVTIWDFQTEDDVFGPSVDDSQFDADNTAVQLSRSQPLAQLATPVLEQLLESSESSQVGFRTKALRGISLFVGQNPELFLQADVRKSIQNRILDSSPAVRDTAIELVGKYVVGRPKMAIEYLPLISDRITDTGLSVRRRVVKLLKVLFSMVDDIDLQANICRKLVWRVLDEDDGVKDLSVDTLEELWFSRNLPTSCGGPDQAPKSGIENLAAIIMRVAGIHKDRPPPVDEVFRLINEKHAEKGTKPPRERLQQVSESLIDSLVVGSEDSPIDVVACIKTIYVLNSADPALLSTAKATLLLSFLKGAATPDEQTVVDYLLKIFRATVLAMPKAQSKFAKDLQARLLPMINKPSPSASTSTLSEIVSCFCAVVRGQTHDFTRMITVFKVCSARLCSDLQKKQSPDPTVSEKVNIRSFPMLSYLTSLLCEHGNFDEIRKTYPETAAEINAITSKSTSLFTYNLLLKIHNLNIPGIQPAILTSLGFLFRGYPTLMLDGGATLIMDAIFKSAAVGSQIQLLRIIQDFLASQSSQESKPAALERGVAQTGIKIDELVGNVEGFADSGVASAICQRYIDQILQGCLSSNQQLQRIAVDILTTVGRSGFSHPLTIAPYLIALTSSSDNQLSKKSFSTLSLLHQKHATLLATRFVPSAKVAFNFASSSSQNSLLSGYAGDPPASYFGRWYSLLQKEKRQHQLDYLKALSRVYEQEPGKACSEDDVAFARFLAEALGTLDFKRLEEPMMIIAYLNAALAVSGLQVLHLLQETTEDGAGLIASITPTNSPVKSIQPNATTNGHSVEVESELSPDLVRQSMVAGIALLLRDFLKKSYGINDAKMQKYAIGKKSAQGDKAAVRRTDAPAALGDDGYERMPLLLQKLDTNELYEEQRDTFIAMIQEDGTVYAVDELDMDDD